MSKKLIISILILLGIVINLVALPITASAASTPSWFSFYWNRIHRGLLQVYKNLASITQLKKDVHKTLLTALYHAGVEDGSITTAKIADEAVTEPKIESTTRNTLMQGFRYNEIETAINFPSIVAQDCATHSFTSIYPMYEDDAVVANPVATTGGTEDLNLTWNVFVSDATTDEITIRVCNPTAGALDPASQDWQVVNWPN